MISDEDEDEADNYGCPYSDFKCVTNVPESLRPKGYKDYKGEMDDVDPANLLRGITYLEFDLCDIAYSYTCGDRTMAHEIGQAIYEWLRKKEPSIDKWYEAL